MQFTLTINQVKALEWGLNSQQALLFAFVYSCPSWTKPVTTDDGVFFALSKAKIVEELPLLTDKPDTAYRLLKALDEAGLIELSSTSNITLFRLTKKAMEWNQKLDGSEKFPTLQDGKGRKKIRPIKAGQVGKKSDQGKKPGSEKSPSRLGKKSDLGSEKNPTNQDTSNQDTNQRAGGAAHDAPPPLGFDSRTRFAMSPDWEPNAKTFPAVLLQLGLNTHSLTEEQFDDQLREYRSFWIASPDDYRTQAKWEHAFAKNLKHQLRNLQAEVSGNGNRTNRTSQSDHGKDPGPGQRTARKGPLSAVDQVAAVIAERNAAQSVDVGQTLAGDGADLRPPLDVEFWCVS